MDERSGEAAALVEVTGGSPAEEANRYIERALRLRSNFESLREEGAVDKASEALWGLFCAYVNAFAIIKTGSPIARHKEIVEFARSIALGREDRTLIEAISAAETMHANFYHEFLKDPSELRHSFELIDHFAADVDSQIRSELAAQLRGRARGVTKARGAG